jgi:hypothetical protein
VFLFGNFTVQITCQVPVEPLYQWYSQVLHWLVCLICYLFSHSIYCGLRSSGKYSFPIKCKQGQKFSLLVATEAIAAFQKHTLLRACRARQVFRLEWEFAQIKCENLGSSGCFSFYWPDVLSCISQPAK